MTAFPENLKPGEPAEVNNRPEPEIFPSTIQQLQSRISELEHQLSYPYEDAYGRQRFLKVIRGDKFDCDSLH